jgi:hypothetical protein
VSLSATSAGIKPSGSSKRRPLCSWGFFLTGAAHCHVALLQQPIEILVQLRQFIPALANLVGDPVGAALGSEWAVIAYGRYK